VLGLQPIAQHELAGKGRAPRCKQSLPGAMATQCLGHRRSAGFTIYPTEIVTSPEDMVDVALAGLDRGEIVTIPSLPG